MNDANEGLRVAVCSRSFSRHPVLRAELKSRYPGAKFNDTGKTLTGQDLKDFIQECRAVIMSLEKVDDDLLDAAPDLEVIAKYGVGFDQLDLDALKRRGIRLGWTSGVNKRSVSELTICFMVDLFRHVPESDRTIRDGGWKNRTGRLLSEATVGVVGFGNIGKDLSVLLTHMGTRVLAHDIEPDHAFAKNTGVEIIDLDPLLQQADVVTLHTPLDAGTRHLMSREKINQMKKGACLINTARGSLVDEDALYNALKSGHLGGAAFDVFETEPPPQDYPLMRLENFISTPHIGGSSEESILAMGRAAIAGLEKNRIPEVGVFPK